MNSVGTHFKTRKKPLSYALSHSDVPPMKKYRRLGIFSICVNWCSKIN